MSKFQRGLSFHPGCTRRLPERSEFKRLRALLSGGNKGSSQQATRNVSKVFIEILQSRYNLIFLSPMQNGDEEKQTRKP